jgi:hypothetical protein
VEKITSDNILQTLSVLHRHESCLFIPEMRIGTGNGAYADQRIDAWVMTLWHSKNFTRISYEIKVSRSDFNKEIKNPVKRKMALLFSDYFYFVAPKGLLKPEEIPPECGLKEVSHAEPDKIRHSYGGLVIKTVIKAPKRESQPPNWRFVASLARRLRDRK